MTKPLFPLLVAGTLLVVACQPWYRDDLRRGRKALRQPSADAVLEKAQRAHNAGDEKRAIALARDAVVRDPRSGPAYEALAGYLRAAGRRQEACFIARRGLEFSNSAALRRILIENSLADGLTSAALDWVDPATVQAAAAAGIPGVADLARAESLASTAPGQALAMYAAWRETYGVPDHPILRADAERIVGAAWADESTRTRLSGLLDAADREAAAGHVAVALVLYSQLLAEVPAEVQAQHVRGYLYAAATAKDPGAIDPRAHDLAVQGDAALAEGSLGQAIQLYRRAVALAPWWSAAQHNLAILFEMAGRTDEARRTRDIAQHLQANLSHPPPPVERSLASRDDDLALDYPDTDRDGLNDFVDECSNEAGPARNQGCPEADPDRDGDGVVDRLDNCPDEIGTDVNHGCQNEQLVALTSDQLTLLEKVSFRTRKPSAILERSRRVLDNVAAVLGAHPEIAKVRIEGHTDSRGSDSKNLRLSQGRAQAVRDYLIVAGIAPARLEAVGYGESKPIASNESRSGRETNDRIEFHFNDE